MRKIIHLNTKQPKFDNLTLGTEPFNFDDACKHNTTTYTDNTVTRCFECDKEIVPLLPKPGNLILYDPLEESNVWEDLYVGNTYAGKTRCPNSPSANELGAIPTKFKAHTILDDYEGREILIIMENGSVGSYSNDRGSIEEGHFPSLQAFADHIYYGDQNAVEEIRDWFYEDSELESLLKSKIPGVKEVLIGDL